MDDRRFDALARSLASGSSRRTVLKGLLGLGGIAAAGAVRQTAEAARRSTPTPQPAKCPGIQTWNGTECDCPDPLTDCGPDCCNTSVPRGNPAHSECCDGACCHGECYGEELCCPTGQNVCNGACCAPGEACFQGACHRCTICGDDCCSGDTPSCCRNGDISTCAPVGATCCTADTDCQGLDFCAGNVAHSFFCVDAVCTESTLSCQGDDPCSQYGCNGGTCTVTRIPGCCTSSASCQAVDACTPANCLEDHTCNAVSACSAGQKCCGGACVSADTHCCTSDGDCSSLVTCNGLTLNDYFCQSGICTQSQINCGGTDPCTHYGCNASGGGCTVSSDASCCSSSDQCMAVDACTPGLCLDNHTCSQVSACSGNETCNQNGTCGPTGCMVDGVFFPPCVTGCNICVAPDGGTLCGCAVTTTQRCQNNAICKELFGTNSICAGAGSNAICVQASGPLN